MRLNLGGNAVTATTGGRELDRDLPLLVFLHGAGNDRTAWQLQTRYFAHHGYSVVAPDLPGHGRSEGRALGGIADYSRWVIDLIAELGWEHAHLCGHSMGSLIALETAAAAPDQIDSISLVGTAASMDVHPDLLDAARANDHLAYDLITGWSHSSGARRGGNQTPGVWMAGTTMRLLERNRQGVLAIDLAACAAYDGRAAAPRVKCPALLVLGSSDLMTRPAAAAPLQEALDHTTVVLEGIGHSMMIEDPDGVIDAIAAFLTDLG